MKLLAVCSYGVGSSMILKISMDRVFEELGVDAEVENLDMYSADGVKCDAIFTSPQLFDQFKQSANVPVYAIRKYMDMAEVKSNIEEFLEYYKNKDA
jgi:Phosphotransferase system, galactitol-specific IIB component